jgi:hypothetical protein
MSPTPEIKVWRDPESGEVVRTMAAINVKLFYHVPEVFHADAMKIIRKFEDDMHALRARAEIADIAAHENFLATEGERQQAPRVTSTKPEELL